MRNGLKNGLWITTTLAVTLLMAVSLSGCILGTPTPAAETDAAATDVPPTAESAPAATTVPAATTATAAPANMERRSYSAPPPMTINVSAEYMATIRTNMGEIKVELFPGQAPMTVNHFVFLSEEGFYDGLIFHRVIDNFMIQGGDPTGNGTGGPGYRFQDEISPTLAFDAPGKLAMANAGAGTATNGSQFFITTISTPHLNGNHTIFGQVTEGQTVVDAISRVSRSAQNRPLRPVTIEGIDIETTPRY